jgi:hypothetical protein
MIHFNIILASTFRSSTWPLLFQLCDKNFVCFSHFPHACYLFHSSMPLTILGEEYKL